MAAFGSLNEVTDQLTDPKLRAHLFDSTVLPALCGVDRWVDTSATSKILRATHRALERCLLKYIGTTSCRSTQLRSLKIIPSLRSRRLHMDSEA